jgi:predicted AlkP superfamily pyrophosphatase or phosphodiesterase
MNRFHLGCVLAASTIATSLLAQTPGQTAGQTPGPTPPTHRNVIIFIADGLRRGSVNEKDMPAFWRIRHEGVDFLNSHAVYPTFTTANASAIATGHGLGDTGDFSNTLWPGYWIGPDHVAAGDGSLVPFLEDDTVLADLNAHYSGSYIGEETLLTAARKAGYAVASVGKLGPTAIQQIDLVERDPQGAMNLPDGIIVDESTGSAAGIPLPVDLQQAIADAGLVAAAPTRSNGFAATAQGNNGYSGTATQPGTLAANVVQYQWLTDVTTRVLLPRFEAEKKPFVLLFWSRDPDGTQHNNGDSLQTLSPGINGPTVEKALQNANHCLQQLLDWLDAHPAIKANTDILLTSDHGFATISRREIARAGERTEQPSARLTYADKPANREPDGTLPSGFLAIDLGLLGHMHVYDTEKRMSTGDSVYAEQTFNGDDATHSEFGSALLGSTAQRLDGSDADVIVASNGGSDLIYVPSKDPTIVHRTLALLTSFDYIGGLFVDDAYCQPATECPGALPLSAVSLKGATKLPTPAIVIAYKVFDRIPGDLQTAIQIADGALQEGQGNHGGLGRDSTWNNMAAIGPDFRKGFVDESPTGNIDIAPTLASLLDLTMPSIGKIRGRVAAESFVQGRPAPEATHERLVSPAAENGRVTVLEFQQAGGTRYFDRACFVARDEAKAGCKD